MAAIDQEIRDWLQEAEKRLRDLIIEAAKAGDYDGIDLARTVAGRVREIAEQLIPEHDDQEPPSKDARPTPSHGARAAASRRKGRWVHYPKFYVEDGVLHKVGWSKKEHEEYVHKVRKEAYAQIVQAIGDLARSRRKSFTSEHLAEQLKARKFTVPIYQVYVALALLRAKKVVEKKGREGYLAPSDVVARAMRLWSQL
jgi:hypothetical protein